jgi:hypothetical protein
MRYALLVPFAALTVLAAPLAGQQPTPQPPVQQGKADSTAVVAQAAALAATFLAQAQVDGQAAATNVGTGGWLAGGYVSGVVLGLIGTAVTWAVAGNTNVELVPDKRLLIANQPLAYQQVYEKAYGDKVRSKRKSSALTGGLLGTATFLVIYLSATSGGGY